MFTSKEVDITSTIYNVEFTNDSTSFGKREIASHSYMEFPNKEIFQCLHMGFVNEGREIPQCFTHTMKTAILGKAPKHQRSYVGIR